MAYVTYTRPLSKVGFRLMDQTRPAHAAALSGLGSLGDDPSTLESYGFSPDQVTAIMLAHNTCALSNEGYQQLLSGNVDPSQLGSFLQADLGCPTDASGAPAPSTPAPAAPPAGVPTGATLLYQASISTHLFSSGTATDFLSAIAGAMPPIGLQVVGSNYSSSGLGAINIQLQLYVQGSGWDTLANAKSVIDHAVYLNRGQMPLSSTLSISSALGAGSGAGGGAGVPIGTFLEQNMATILLALGAIVVLPALIKKL